MWNANTNRWNGYRVCLLLIRCCVVICSHYFGWSCVWCGCMCVVCVCSGVCRGIRGYNQFVWIEFVCNFDFVRFLTDFIRIFGYREVFFSRAVESFIFFSVWRNYSFFFFILFTLIPDRCVIGFGDVWFNFVISRFLCWCFVIHVFFWYMHTQRIITEQE